MRPILSKIKISKNKHHDFHQKVENAVIMGRISIQQFPAYKYPVYHYIFWSENLTIKKNVSLFLAMTSPLTVYESCNREVVVQDFNT